MNITMTWEKWYELAVNYYNFYGDLRVKQSFRTINGYEYDEKGYGLGMWLNNQHTRNNNGLLTEEQRKKLEQLGINFENTQSFRWNRMYELARSYFQHCGNLKIRNTFKTFDGYTYDEKGWKLGVWLNDQRIAYKKGLLSADRISKLKSIGAILENVCDDNWNKMYTLAQKFYEHYGHLRIPIKFKTKNGYERSKEGENLGTWIGTQRRLYAKGELSEERIEKLQQIKMAFSDVNDEKWDINYNLAKTYYEHYGHLRITRSFKTKDGYTYAEDGHCLNPWLDRQRMLYRSHRLSEERIRRLEMIGMVFVVKQNIDKNILLCEQYGINYDLNRQVIDVIAYRELLAKINYLNSLGIALTIEGQMHPIFSIGNINMQVRYGIDLETLITEYSYVEDKVKTK